MYGKEEAKELKKAFWTSFGMYMKKYNLIHGKKTNWVNYNTKIKDVYFRLNADNKKVSFAVEIQHTDEGIRELYFQQFQELKMVLQANFKQDLRWEERTGNDFGIAISKIGCEHHGVSVFDKNTWKDAFSFMEENLLAIHEFWEDYQEIFKQLE